MSLSETAHNNENISVKPERLSRNSIWIFLGQASTVSISFVTIFFLTRYLGPAKFGMYSIAFVLAGLFMPLSDLGLNLHFNKTVSANPNILKQELSQTISFRVILALIIWGIMILTGYVLQYSSEQILYVALAGLSIMIMSLGQTFIMALRSLRRMKYESLSTVYCMGAKLVGILSMIVLNAQISAIIIAHLIGSLVFLIMPIIYLSKLIGRLSYNFNLAGLKERLISSIPFGATAIFFTVYMRIDTVMLSKIKDSSEVGFYSGAHNIILASMILATPLIISIFPVMAKTYKDDRLGAEKIFNQVFSILTMIGIPIGLAVFFISEPLILFTYGDKFIETAPILCVLAGAIPLLFLTQLMGSSLGAVGYQKWFSGVMGFILFLNIILNLILIPKYGGRGAALSKLTTEIIGFFVVLFLTRKVFTIDVFSNVLKLFIFGMVSALVFLLANNTIGSLLSILLFGFVYCGLLFAFKVIKIKTIINLLRFSASK